MVLNILIGVMSFFGFLVLVALTRDILKHKSQLEENVKGGIAFLMGFVGNFLDAIGIGSFAVVISLNRIFKMIPDKVLVGTLVVGIASIPTIVSTIYLVGSVEVDTTLLVCTTIAAAIGTFVGAKLISGFSERGIRLVVGTILVIVGLILLSKMMFGNPESMSTATSLSLPLSIIAVIGVFIIGVLQGFGLGFFAPTLALFVMLGLSTKSIWPIMFAGCGFGVLAGSFEYIAKGTYLRKASPYMAVGGVIGVIIALQFVTNVDVSVLNWLVAFILLYIGGEMFLKGIKTNKA